TAARRRRASAPDGAPRAWRSRPGSSAWPRSLTRRRRIGIAQRVADLHLPLLDRPGGVVQRLALALERPHALLQLLARVVEPAADGADRNPEVLGDLGPLELVPVKMQQQLLGPQRQLTKRLDQHPRVVAGHDLLKRRVRALDVAGGVLIPVQRIV